jgi:hypothetical protein
VHLPDDRVRPARRPAAHERQHDLDHRGADGAALLSAGVGIDPDDAISAATTLTCSWAGLKVGVGLTIACSQLRAAATRSRTRAIVTDAESVPFVDVSGVRMLDELSDALDALGVELAIAHDIGQVRDMLAKAPVLRGPEGAVQAAVDSLAPSRPVSRPRR